MGDFLNTLSSQNQRAINEALIDQIVPQIQATLRSGQGQMPERRWEVPARRQGFISEEALNRRFVGSSRDEGNRDSNINEILNNACYMVTGYNESPNMIPELLTGQIPLRPAPSQPPFDHNDP